MKMRSRRSTVIESSRACVSRIPALLTRAESVPSSRVGLFEEAQDVGLDAHIRADGDRCRSGRLDVFHDVLGGQHDHADS